MTVLKTSAKPLCMLLFALIAYPLVAQPQQQPNDYYGVRTLAMRGDYQAQRNLAFGYGSAPYKGQTKNALLACAWYQVVLFSGSSRVFEGDVNNVKVYCGALDATSAAAATEQGRQLFKAVYRREPGF